jgi:hypothetical protein
MSSAAAQANGSRQDEDIGFLRTVVGVLEGAERENPFGDLAILIRLQTLGRCGRRADQGRKCKVHKARSHAPPATNIIARIDAEGSLEAIKIKKGRGTKIPHPRLSLPLY